MTRLALIFAFCLAASAAGSVGASRPAPTAGGGTAAQAASRAQPAAAGKRGAPIATVDGRPIYADDLASTIAPKMLQLRNQEYEIRRQALDALIRRKLVEIEAKKRGISPEKLLEQEADSKVGEPGDAELRGYYLAIKDEVKQPFDQAKAQLRVRVKQLEIQHARGAYEDSLRANAKIAIFLHPPTVQVGYDPTRVRGDANAPVTIVEFGDFQCPYCRRAQTTLRDLLAKYKGRVKLAFRDFPLRTIHPQAEIAAEAARCAEAQGKFWPFHDALYADQSKLSQPELIATAQSLGLDGNTFQSCLADGKFADQVEQDVQAGAQLGVDATPTFFINGVLLQGAQPEAQFEKIIDAELAAPKSGKPAVASR
jgi:protein-disulfide isomerase